MGKTYDLIVFVEELAADIVASEGEITEEQSARLDDLLGDGGEVAHQLEALHAVVRRLKATTKYLKEEESRICRRRQSAEGHARYLTERAGQLLAAHEGLTGEHLVKTELGSAWLQDSHSLLITDASAIPTQYREPRIHYRKAEMKTALKRGEAVPGVELETIRSIRWR